MIDTVRLRGPANTDKFPPDFTKYTTLVNSFDQEKIPTFCYKQTDNYRIFLHPAENDMSVEFNIAKIIYGHNCYNYEKNPAALLSLLHRFGSYFFTSGSYYVSRIDIGAVFLADSPAMADNTIERYRNAKLPRARVRQMKGQNYESSVFYPSDGWSMKVYHKGRELKKIKQFETLQFNFPYDLNCLVRSEKTYRPREFKRLGMDTEPYKGVHIDSFFMDVVVDDFLKTLNEWTFNSVPYITEMKGVLGLIDVINNAGLLSECYASGSVSRSSYYRYLRERRAAVVANDFQNPFNLNQMRPPNEEQLKKVLMFGPVI